jgi:hypothetical protein
VKKRTGARWPSVQLPERRCSNSLSVGVSVAADLRDDGAARHAAAPSDVAGIRDVHAADRHVDVTRLLPRQVVHDPSPNSRY